MVSIILNDTETTYIFFFNDTAPTEIYTLSLHDALPISGGKPGRWSRNAPVWAVSRVRSGDHWAPMKPSLASQSRADRKSTRLNSSHANISYAVFCLKKKI